MALGPTSLAHPRVATPGPDPAGPGSLSRSLKPLASFASEALDSALRSAPSWVTRRLVVIAASGAAALLATVLVVATSSHGGTAPGPSAATRPALPPRPPDPKTDDVVAAASAKIDKGDLAPAIDALSSIEKAGPDRADVHALLERGYTGVHNTHDAIREAGLWLAADPDAAADPKLQEDIRNAAVFRDGQDEAFTLLESRMGARGVDLLFDIAYGASGRQYPQAAARARHSLDVDDVRSRASPALAVLLDFREAKTCEAKRALIDRARAYGDARMASALQPYLATRGCGFFGHADCYPCLHKDGALKDAIGAIGER
jgi:serine/threonine-protein kinase